MTKDNIQIASLDEIGEQYTKGVGEIIEISLPEIKEIERQDRIVSNMTWWTMAQFKETLKRMKKELGYDLTMKRRRVFFQTFETINKKDKNKDKELIDRYGSLFNISGDCIFDETNKVWGIRVAIIDRGYFYPKEVFDILSHEYGHTLGRMLDTFPEELKAYAFSSLFSRFRNGKSLYESESSCESKSIIHEEAKRTLTKYLSSGIKEEAILSRLFGEKFGGFSPNDFSFFKNPL